MSTLLRNIVYRLPLNNFQWSKVKYHLPRLVLGAIFLLSGLNGFFGFLPEPTFSEQGQRFIDEIKATGFLWPLLKAVEIVGGYLLISSSAGRLGILVVAPVALAIALFHLTLSHQGAWLGYTVFALEVLLVVLWRKNLIRIFHHPHSDGPHRRKLHVN